MATASYSFEVDLEVYSYNFFFDEATIQVATSDGGEPRQDDVVFEVTLRRREVYHQVVALTDAPVELVFSIDYDESVKNIGLARDKLDSEVVVWRAFEPELRHYFWWLFMWHSTLEDFINMSRVVGNSLSAGKYLQSPVKVTVEGKRDVWIVADEVLPEPDPPIEFLPTRLSAIEDLPVVDVLSGPEKEKCLICFEELVVGEKVITRLPCSHLFHRDCITPWLNISHLCPKCRFRMPH